MDIINLSKYLPQRHRDAHKGDFGHVLIIGGDYGMSGAVRMAGEAALRVGAGLVSIATRSEHAAIISGARPEIMSHTVETEKKLLQLIEKASVIVIGPGLGQSDWSKLLFQTALRVSKIKVIDADGLNWLAKSPERQTEWILTPHVGEASRLLTMDTTEIQQNRLSSATKITEQYGGVCVLKGAGTVVYDHHQLPYVCSLGNPGMASGGMGDVLSGVIAGLLAQGLSLFDAATVGVFLHAKAGDLAAQSQGERGLLATDLMMELWRLVNPC